MEDLLDAALAKTNLSPADRGLCQELVYGAARRQATLDWLIEKKTTPGRTQKPMLQILLRLGLYQIFWLDRIPNHAAVNETVEQAKQAGFGPQAGFINAVLRGYLREFDATKALLEELKKSQPHIGYSHPEWLVARWQKRWGTEKAAALMEWNNTAPKTFARINELKFSKDAKGGSVPQFDTRGRIAQPIERASGAAKAKDAGDVLALWRQENVDYDFVRRDWLDENEIFELKLHPSLAKLRSFQEGLFYIQDPSTLLAVDILAPKLGENVLDLCAAPGGKTTYIAQRMRNEGRLVAQDTSPDRLKMIVENCARLGVKIATAILPSALDAQPAPFDRVLVDAPCSNTGVMRRRVDLRWRIRQEELERLRATQLDLLNQAKTRVKTGGVLVYSTCSLEPEENDGVVREFLASENNFELEEQRELVPFTDGVDGAFVARLKKK